MLKTKCVLIVFILIGFQNAFSQSIELSGRVESKTNVENIHVINKTAHFFTITDENGHFTINAKLNDTLTFYQYSTNLKK